MTEIKSTTQYDQFKFREDNRAHINLSHVKRLSESIQASNLLELRPISVNESMEVIDGQHRLLAAKMLGVPIFYIQRELSPQDIIRMNVSQAWGQSDYLNYYCKNMYPEYVKLRQFMQAHGISIKVALSITMGHKKDSYVQFKQGLYRFKEDDFDAHIESCWETIDYIKKINGYSAYTGSSRFWGALLVLVRHANFDQQKWRENLKRMIERFTPKASQADYLRMLMDVYNWRNNNKVELINGE